MRILLVCPEVPWPMDQGGRTRTYQLLVRGLASLGHQVDALLVRQEGQGKHLDAFTGLLRSVQYLDHRTRRWDPIVRLGFSLIKRTPYADLKFTPRGLPGVVRELCAAERYDVIVAEHQHVAESVVGVTGLPVVVDMQNLYSELYTRVGRGAVTSIKTWHSRVQARFTRRQEAYLARAARLLVVSPEEAAVLQRRTPSARPFLVPNGVDTEYFRPRSGTGAVGGVGGRVSLVMTGSMDYFPNVEGAIYFVREVLPLIWEGCPEAHFSIVGRAPVPSVIALGRDPRITVTGTVEDVRPHLDGAAVAVVPLVSGAGSRLKALEAAAMGRAIVGTSVGLEGIPFTSGEDAIIVDPPRGQADAILDLIRRPTVRAEMGAKARRFVEAGYSWQTCWKALGRALDSVADAGAAAEVR